VDLKLSAEDIRALDEASQIELGFPHDFLDKPMVKTFTFGGVRDSDRCLGDINFPEKALRRFSYLASVSSSLSWNVTARVWESGFETAVIERCRGFEFLPSAIVSVKDGLGGA
jgi:hypothetical protein